jgi:phosphonate transport system permease protein
MATTAPALRDPAWLPRLAWGSAGLVLLWPLLVATEFKPWVLWDARSLGGRPCSSWA